MMPLQASLRSSWVQGWDWQRYACPSHGRVPAQESWKRLQRLTCHSLFSAQRKKLRECFLWWHRNGYRHQSCVLQYDLSLTCCCLFFLLSFCHILFMTEKYAKGPGTRKFQSISFLFRNCWGNILQSKRFCRLIYLLDFWVLRDFLSYPLAGKRVTSGQTGLALFPKIKLD